MYPAGTALGVYLYAISVRMLYSAIVSYWGDLDYTWLWLCDDYITWAMLADVAHLLEPGNDGHDFRARALAAGPRPQH